MKKKKPQKDPRHQKRVDNLKLLFAWELNKTTITGGKIRKIVVKVNKIDKIIVKCAPKWPLSKINKIDLAILRLAIFELFYDDSIPSKVAIDEAVELAKEYGSESSSGFINGVLGSAYELTDKKDEN